MQRDCERNGPQETVSYCDGALFFEGLKYFRFLQAVLVCMCVHVFIIVFCGVCVTASLSLSL